MLSQGWTPGVHIARSQNMHHGAPHQLRASSNRYPSLATRASYLEERALDENERVLKHGAARPPCVAVAVVSTRHRMWIMKHMVPGCVGHERLWDHRAHHRGWVNPHVDLRADPYRNKSALGPDDGSRIVMSVARRGLIWAAEGVCIAETVHLAWSWWRKPEAKTNPNQSQNGKRKNKKSLQKTLTAAVFKAFQHDLIAT